MIYTENTDIVVGIWNDYRMGTFRGTRSGVYSIGGTAFGEKKNLALGEEHGYNPLLIKIIEFFNTGIPPVSPEETIEIYAFMSAAEESKANNGMPVEVEKVRQKALRKAKNISY